MDHAITVGNVISLLGVIGVLALITTILLGILYIAGSHWDH